MRYLQISCRSFDISTIIWNLYNILCSSRYRATYHNRRNLNYWQHVLHKYPRSLLNIFVSFHIISNQVISYHIIPYHIIHIPSPFAFYTRLQIRKDKWYFAEKTAADRLTSDSSPSIKEANTGHNIYKYTCIKNTQNMIQNISLSTLGRMGISIEIDFIQCFFCGLDKIQYIIQ